MKNKKIKIIALVSREWSKSILDNIVNYKKKIADIELVFFKNIKFSKTKFKSVKNLKKNKVSNYIKKIIEIQPDLILAYGWRDYIPKNIRDIAPCLILHPSKLPLYRGGSPIQHQLINNEKNSAVTILVANNKIDSGPILYQKKIKLEGYLDDILERIINIGTDGTIKIIQKYKNNKLIMHNQNEKDATYFKRRTPEMSEIFHKDFKNQEAKYFYNLIRGLQSPYPECFIRCKNNTKLYFKKVYVK